MLIMQSYPSISFGIEEPIFKTWINVIYTSCIYFSLSLSFSLSFRVWFEYKLSYLQSNSLIREFFQLESEDSVLRNHG